MHAYYCGTSYNGHSVNEGHLSIHTKSSLRVSACCLALRCYVFVLYVFSWALLVVTVGELNTCFFAISLPFHLPQSLTAFPFNRIQFSSQVEEVQVALLRPRPLPLALWQLTSMQLWPLWT